MKMRIKWHPNWMKYMIYRMLSASLNHLIWIRTLFSMACTNFSSHRECNRKLFRLTREYFCGLAIGHLHWSNIVCSSLKTLCFFSHNSFILEYCVADGARSTARKLRFPFRLNENSEETYFWFDNRTLIEYRLQFIEGYLRIFPLVNIRHVA